jgi:hypothetical protein
MMLESSLSAPFYWLCFWDFGKSLLQFFETFGMRKMAITLSRDILSTLDDKSIFERKWRWFLFLNPYFILKKGVFITQDKQLHPASA